MQRTKNILESLLFVARKPLSSEDAAKVFLDAETDEKINLTPELAAALLEELVLEYKQKGIQIAKVAGGYLMGTNAENANFVHQLLHEKVHTHLSPQSLVTLSIIAYKQPITRAEIERIRGVNSDGPIDTLLAKGFIREIGRSDALGSPYLYATTEHFLRQFGLKDLEDLPPLPESEAEQQRVFDSALHEEENEPEPSPNM